MVDPFDAITLPDLPTPTAPMKKARKPKKTLAEPAQEVLPPVVPSAREPKPYEPKALTDESGRTYKQPKVDLDEIEMMASVGMNTKQIADALHISPGVFGKLVKNDPLVQEAIDRGAARGVKMVTDALFQNAMKGNVAAQIFFLKNKAAWQDKTEIDQNLTVEKKMDFDSAVELLKQAGVDPSKL